MRYKYRFVLRSSEVFVWLARALDWVLYGDALDGVINE